MATPFVTLGMEYELGRWTSPEGTIIWFQSELMSLIGDGRLRSGLAALNAGGSTPDHERALYRLTAVVVHVGGPRSGHFATYRRGNGFEARR